jgi:predicted aconitase with swiveling domain
MVEATFALHEVIPSKEPLCGELIVVLKPIAYLGDIDPDAGYLYGKHEISGRLLVFPNAVGSTVGSYILYALSRGGKSPAAMIVTKVDPITIIGCIISDIPLYSVDPQELARLSQFNGRKACIRGGELAIEV